MQNNNQDKNHPKIQPKKQKPQILMLTEVSDVEAEIVTGGSEIVTGGSLSSGWNQMTWDN
ncbi:hypothetical protein H6G33_08905 [Calothrix sp. FACHB-1219]|uniref:hypothetical protein n=1 Tax=unclassified Calothrix TaxID=2619626 RepID=UPI00168A0A8D|nr:MULTISPECIES: hypothetical protein [unclassified Calothrix]MBD2202115.1 hypothetical protein [Calothrix sp. FACHB-168]MBD2217149.1 hypothetical protein [Calothrix sp. FACHB-1219]